MRRIPLALALFLLAFPALARSIPVFDDPKALLEAIYGQYETYEKNYADGIFDPDAGFDETEAFSARLGGLLREADEKVHAAGDEVGALDFSPFINGQDTGGLSYVIHDPKVKGPRAVSDVEIVLEGNVLYTITFHFVDEGAERGWKVDEILLPSGDSPDIWPLSDYLKDPLL